MGRKNEKKTRNLILVFGDQLDSGSAAFDGFETGKDAVLMMEVKKPPSVAKKSTDGVAVSQPGSKERCGSKQNSQVYGLKQSLMIGRS